MAGNCCLEFRPVVSFLHFHQTYINQFFTASTLVTGSVAGSATSTASTGSCQGSFSCVIVAKIVSNDPASRPNLVKVDTAVRRISPVDYGAAFVATSKMTSTSVPSLAISDAATTSVVDTPDSIDMVTSLRVRYGIIRISLSSPAAISDSISPNARPDTATDCFV